MVEGCLTLHFPHLALTASKSAYIPDQNTVFWAKAVQTGYYYVYLANSLYRKYEVKISNQKYNC